MADKETATLEKPNLDAMNDNEAAAYEGDLLNAILHAANYQKDESEYRRISIKRGDKIRFKFLVRPMSEEEQSKIRDKNTKSKTGRYGIAQDKTDLVRYHNQLIYEATVPEEATGGVKIWDYNRQILWQRLNVASGIDAVGAILKAGEKDMVLDVIEKISGFRADDFGDDIKN